MHIKTGLIVFSVITIAAGLFAEESPEIDAMRKKLKSDLDIGPIAKSDFRDDKKQKFQQVKLTTEQDKDSPFLGVMRFTVEVTDSAQEIWYGQKTKAQAKHPAQYDGKDEWTFEFPEGTMEKPKITAYALEYGFETNKVFVPVEQKFLKVESAEEIMDRNKDPNKKISITSKTKALR